MTSRRIVFLDVDGTILEGSRVDPSAGAAVRAARVNGHLVYLCTGRSEADLHPEVREIGFDGAITNSGSFVRSGDDLVLARTMPRAEAELLVAYFTRPDMEFFLQAHDGVYASRGAHELIQSLSRQVLDQQPAASDGKGDRRLVPLIQHRPLAEADLSGIAKAVFVSSDAEGLARAQADLGDRFHIVPGSFPLPGGSNGEVGMLGTNKGSAITHVLASLGADPQDAIGIGDSWNDIEMFETVGTAVAMGNAAPELRARADRVTTAVLDDGVWNAFVELGLV